MLPKPQLLRGLALGAVVLGMAAPHVQAQTPDRKTALSGYVGSLQYNGNMGSDYWNRSGVDIEVGGGGSITRYLSPTFDIAALGYYETFKFSDHSVLASNFEARVGMIDLGLKLKLNNGKILKEDFFIQPYLMAGPGFFLTNTSGQVQGRGFGVDQIRRPELFGQAGLRFRLSSVVSLDLTTSQHFPLTDRVDNMYGSPDDKLYDRFLLNQAGITIALGKAKDEDKDGVSDKKDKCPGTPAGVAVDPTGCPLDKDGDGVPDYQDKCPDRAGPASNKGCPEIKAEAKKILNEATKYINFDFNKATLKPSSYPKLDQLVQILKDYPDYSLSIAGHTDSKGADDFNLGLSYERAASARTYLLSKGITVERIEARGYGETKPIADNATAAGQALNRRVDFDPFLTGETNAAEVKYGPAPTIKELKAQGKPVPTRKAVVKKAPAKKAPVKKAPAKKAPANKAPMKRK